MFLNAKEGLEVYPIGKIVEEFMISLNRVSETLEVLYSLNPG